MRLDGYFETVAISTVYVPSRTQLIWSGFKLGEWKVYLALSACITEAQSATADWAVDIWFFTFYSEPGWVCSKMLAYYHPEDLSHFVWDCPWAHFFGQKLPKSAKKGQKAVFLISTVRKLSSYDELWTVKLTWPNSATRFGRKSPKWQKSATRNGKKSPKWPKSAKNGEKGFYGVRTTWAWPPLPEAGPKGQSKASYRPWASLFLNETMRSCVLTISKVPIIKCQQQLSSAELPFPSWIFCCLWKIIWEETHLSSYFGNHFV